MKNSTPEVLSHLLLGKISPDGDESSENVPVKSEKPSSSRSECFFKEENESVFPQDLLEFTTRAFSRALTKNKWLELTSLYPSVKETDTSLVSPTMEAGMKEDIMKQHGHSKTKELFSFDDGLAERQAAFLYTARPILSALAVLARGCREGR